MVYKLFLNDYAVTIFETEKIKQLFIWYTFFLRNEVVKAKLTISYMYIKYFPKTQSILSINIEGIVR